MNIRYFMPEQASTIAPEIDLVYFTLTAVSLLFIVAIAIGVLYCAIRYARRSKDETGELVHDSHVLEIGWSVFPTILGVGLFIVGALPYVKMKTIPSDAMEIAVVAKQWMWKYQHPSGRREVNDLHVPVGRAVHMKMISQDVIHSFFVPAFRIKQDVLPMYYTSVWFEATKEGVYHIFCTEYCGKDHSIMGGKVTVMSQSDYDAWITSDPAIPRNKAALAAMGNVPAPAAVGGSGLAKEGAQVFQTMGCVACHGAADGVGPALKGLPGRTTSFADGSSLKADDNYIRQSILTPMAKVKAGFTPLMPTFQGRITEEQVNALIAYIKSL